MFLSDIMSKHEVNLSWEHNILNGSFFEKLPKLSEKFSVQVMIRENGWYKIFVQKSMPVLSSFVPRFQKSHLFIYDN